METPTSFGLWLRQRRRVLDLTQNDLARCAGCSVSAIRKIEADERRPSRQVAELLADCLEIPPEERSTFLKVARAELRIDRLGELSSASLPSRPPVPLPTFGLPTPPTPLLGREHELAGLVRLLHNPECRLLTLTGSGGIGKTRLAIEVASHHRETFGDGVYFISLSPVSGSEFIAPAIASAIGFTFYGPTDPQVQLLRYLHDKHLLLVLDNFEHLLTTATGGIKRENSAEGCSDGSIALLSEVLQQAPAVKLLVTSRERLNLQGEWVFEVQGLAVPADEQVGEVETYSAVALFVHSTYRIQADFQLTPEDRIAVVRICQLLQGLPLGLELAAAWVRVLSCRDIVREIEGNLDFLRTSARNVPERHRSLRAAFDHSWKLLTEAEQRVLRRLSVFRGGFEREAAEWIAGATLPLLSALVDKSLLRRSEARRYDLHDLVRQYAAMQLQPDLNEVSATHDRHAAYYTRLLQRQKSYITSPQQKEALALLTVEIDNLRSAWDWSLTQANSDNLQRSGLGLLWFYERKNWYQEGIATFGRAVEILSSTQGNMAEVDPLYAGALSQAMTGLGVCCFRSGQNERAKVLFNRAAEMLRPLHRQVEPELAASLSEMLVVTLFYLAIVYYTTGDYGRSHQCLSEGKAISQAIDLMFMHGQCLVGLGIISQTMGNISQANELIEEGVDCLRGVGDPAGLAWALSYASGVARATGNFALARQLLNESLELGRAVGDRWCIATALYFLGLLAYAEQDYDTAQTHLRDSANIFGDIEARWWNTARSLKDLAYAVNATGASAEAEQYFLAALRASVQSNVLHVALDVLVGLATIYAQTNTPERALKLVAYALQHPVSTPEVKDRAEKLCADLEKQLSPPQIEAIQQQAQTSTFDVVVQELLANLSK